MLHRRLTWLAVALVFAGAAPALAQPVPGECHESVLPTGARTKICVPVSGWNGQLLVFVGGYVPDVPGATLRFQDTLPGVGELSTLAQGLGFAYATTSYRRNGLIILDGIQDVRDLVALFERTVGRPLRSYLAGGSEGGLVATLTAERFPALFTGAYATCGPVGSFRHEITYLADFRVLFDHFFPGVFEGNATVAAPDDIQAWLTGTAQTLVAQRMLSEPARALELMKVARVPLDPGGFAGLIASAVRVLAYTVLGANDLSETLGGSPYDNRLRWYSGSSNDLRLNLRIRRFTADPAALLALQPYETTGALQVPLVTLHTTHDDVVPFAQEVFYFLKARPSGRGRFLPLPVSRFGHCTFTAQEIVTGLGVLVLQP